MNAIPFYPLAPELMVLHMQVSELAKRLGVVYWLSCMQYGPDKETRWYGVVKDPRDVIHYCGRSVVLVSDALSQMLEELKKVSRARPT